MKTSRLAILLLCTILASAIFTVEYSSKTQAQTATALHVEGNKIKDAYDNTVLLRGIGRAGDIESASGIWSGSGEVVFEWGKKWVPINDNIDNMQATLQCYQNMWKVNLIRVFINVNWYLQDNITPSAEDPKNYPAATTPISYRTYLKTLTNLAAEHGIYIDICPYQLLSGYQTQTSGSQQGLPLMEWEPDCTTYLNYPGQTEQEFWNKFWTTLATEMKPYPNAIFEAYNEPQNTGTDNITSGYLTYLKTTYNAIRTVGCDNLIFMQWQAGYIPDHNDLGWCKQLSDAIPGATNLVYSTHVYRHAPYFNKQWGTSNSIVETQLALALKSMGVNAPLVINEAGCCQNTITSHDLTNEVNWWQSLCSNTKTFRIGLTAYYWMSDNDLGPTYSGLSLLKGKWIAGAQSPTPNQFGNIFLNTASTTKPIPSQPSVP